MGCSSPQNATLPNIPHAHLNRVLHSHPAPSGLEHRAPAQRQQEVRAPVEDKNRSNSGIRLQESR